MKAARRTLKSRCVICGVRSQAHHVGGRRHLIWLYGSLCQIHHDYVHRLIKTAGVNLEYTDDPVERLIRATKAINIFMCVVLDALHEARSREIKK